MATTPSLHRLAYRPDIDGLRALAVLAVLGCHVGLGCPGGYVGVDVFFVLSGFLITSLLRQDLLHGQFSLADFWERRIRRIFPALFAVTGATLLAAWFLLFPTAYKDLARSVLALLGMGANVYFWRTTGYFAAAAEAKPLLHTWSLAVEEQFYLLVPVALGLLARQQRLHRALPLLLVAMVASFALSVYGVQRQFEGAYFLLPSRAWELLAGSALAFLPGWAAQGPARFGNLLAALGLALILGPCGLYTAATPFPGLAAVPPVLGTALLIWAGMGAAPLPFLNRLLATRPVVFVGLISYSLYLWHWPLLVLTKSQLILPLSLGGKVGVVAASVALAVASWRWIETPFRRRQVLGPRRLLLRGTVAGVVGLAGAGVVLVVGGGFESRLPPAARRFAAFAHVDSRYTYQVNVEDLPGKVPVLGRGETPPQFLVWGDSHAMALLPAIAALCEENGLRASAVTHSVTPPVLNYVPNSGLREQTIPFNRAVLGYIRSQKLPVVVLAARWGQYFTDPRFAPALQQTLDALLQDHVRVYLVTDSEFPYDVPKALALYSWHGWDLSGLGLTPEVRAEQRQSYAAFFAALAQEGVTVLDPLPIFQARTGSHQLLPFDDGGSFYRDEHHFSTYGALALKPLFAPLFAGLVPPTPTRRDRQSGFGALPKVPERAAPPTSGGSAATDHRGRASFPG